MVEPTSGIAPESRKAAIILLIASTAKEKWPSTGLEE